MIMQTETGINYPHLNIFHESFPNQFSFFSPFLSRFINDFIWEVFLMLPVGFGSKFICYNSVEGEGSNCN